MADDIAFAGVVGNSRDGHRRVTRGENFVLVGGDKEVHERMQEHGIKIAEECKRRGKDPREMGRREFGEVVDKSCR